MKGKAENYNEEVAVTKELDATGLWCPGPDVRKS